MNADDCLRVDCPLRKYCDVLAGILRSIDSDRLTARGMNAEILTVLHACVSDALLLAKCDFLSPSP